MSIIINEGRDAARPDNPEPKKETKTISFQHQKVLNQMLATIASCPMDSELKMILRMRIWGRDQAVFLPMSYENIAILLKTRVNNVKRWEQDGLYNLEQFLNRSGIVTIQEKFLRDGNLKQLMEDKKKIIV